MALGGQNSPPGGVPNTKGLPVVRGFQNTNYLGAVPVAVAIGIPLEMGGVPARSRKVYYQGRFEPPPIIQVAGPSYGWWNALSKPLPSVKAQPGFASVPFNTASAATYTDFGWSQPLSTAPVALKAESTDWQVPNPVVSVVTTAWQQPLSAAPLVKHTVDTNQSVPVYTIPAPDNNVTLDKWQPPLSTAPLVTKAQQGSSFVPLNTTPQPVSPYTGIPLDMGGASPRVRQTYYQGRFEPPYVVPVVVTSVYGWWSPLSTAPPSAKAQQGFAAVPLNTAQTPAYTAFGWYQPLSIPPPIAKPQPGWTFVPFNTVQVIFNNVTIDKWQSPLSTPRYKTLFYQSDFELPYVAIQVTPPATPDVIHSIPFLATMGSLLTR